MSSASEPFRTIRLAYELRIEASAQRTFEVMTQQVLDWFPHTCGGDRVRRVVLEPRVGGQHYEDWGEDRGHLYGQVTVFDPPSRRATRGRLSPGTILDAEYELTEEPGAVRVRVTKVAAGPREASRSSPPWGSARQTRPASSRPACLAPSVRRWRVRLLADGRPARGMSGRISRSIRGLAWLGQGWHAGSRGRRAACGTNDVPDDWHGGPGVRRSFVMAQFLMPIRLVVVRAGQPSAGKER